MSSSQQDRPEFHALLGLLPADLRDEPAEAWDIGEQEGALATLVKVLADADIAVHDVERARIAVLCEAWGCWEALCDPLAECRRDERTPAAVTVIEHTEEGTRATAALSGRPSWPDHTAIAWIACRRCDDILVRIHKTMPWGVSPITSAYAIVQGGSHPPRTPIHSSHDAGGPALTALLETHHRTA